MESAPVGNRVVQTGQRVESARGPYGKQSAQLHPSSDFRRRLIFLQQMPEFFIVGQVGYYFCIQCRTCYALHPVW